MYIASDKKKNANLCLIMPDFPVIIDLYQQVIKNHCHHIVRLGMSVI